MAPASPPVHWGLAATGITGPLAWPELAPYTDHGSGGRMHWRVTGGRRAHVSSRTCVAVMAVVRIGYRPQGVCVLYYNRLQRYALVLRRGSFAHPGEIMSLS
jgi:hypothetical protein